MGKLVWVKGKGGWSLISGANLEEQQSDTCVSVAPQPDHKHANEAPLERFGSDWFITTQSKPRAETRCEDLQTAAYH